MQELRKLDDQIDSLLKLDTHVTQEIFVGSKREDDMDETVNPDLGLDALQEYPSPKRP